MEISVPGLPPLPWQVAPDDPPDTEIVAEFEGQWEPKRECVFYGSPDPGGIYDKPTPRSATLRLRRFHDVVLAPHHVVLSYRDGRVLPVTFALDHSEGWLAPGSKDIAAPQQYNPWPCRAEPARVDDPVFLAEPNWNEYGHVLLEVVPKLPMLERLPAAVKVVTSGWSFPPMLAALGASDLRLVSFHGPLFCRTVYVPDPPIDIRGNFHTMAREAYTKVTKFVADAERGRPKRIFLSRSRIATRRLENEAEVERLFEGLGFEIISPEILPVAEQINLVASADMIAGCAGSAMHSLVFARGDTRVVILSQDKWHSSIDAYIAKTDRQYGYVIGRGRPHPGAKPRQWSWSVDINLVEHAIREHFGL